MPNISTLGAGVGVSETGKGYYLGGWFSNKSMNKGPKKRTMISDFYVYDYDSNKFSSPEGPDKLPRAEGGMVWLPAGDSPGMLIYMGGIVSRDDDDESPQPLDEIHIMDTSSGKWYKQKTTGMTPPNRWQFCLDVAWAPDKSSYNIYLWGGLAVSPPEPEYDSYSDVYILTLPSFNWVKISPGSSPGNKTGKNGRYGSSCNMVKDMSQFFIIGGKYTNDTNTKCDAESMWGVHDLWTGTANNTGENTFWYQYSEDVDTNVVPAAVYNIIDGDKNGGAKLRKPKGGYSDDNFDLSVLFDRKWSTMIRKPTRKILGGSKLGTGAIVGIAIGGAVVLAILMCTWYRYGKRVLQRREDKHQSRVTEKAQQMQQQSQESQCAKQTHYSFYGGSTVGSQSVSCPQSPGPNNWGMPSTPASPDPQYQMVPSKLPAENGDAVRHNNPPPF